MKQRIARKLVSLSLLLSVFASNVALATAQTTPKNGFNALPSNSVEDSTAERRDAYNNISDTEQTQASQEVKALVDNAVPTKQPDMTTDLSFIDDAGNSNELTSGASVDHSSDFFGQITSRYFCYACTPPVSKGDADTDGLNDSFENSLADGFTPLYFVSSGENAGTGFARFNDSVPQTISQVFGSTPPISHFRVKPLGFFNRNDGVQYGLIQINYHTLWNRDDGLAGSPFCVVEPIINTSSIGGHSVDNEYSAILVAAPAIEMTYDTNIANYKLYEAYTAAHENTFFDQSRRYNLRSPYPFGSHIKLWLSRSKHATYVFNPNYFPIVPLYIIRSVYQEIESKYRNGIISYNTYLIYLFIADQTFRACVIERFGDQGGGFANTRINVGELERPINGSSFIQDTQLSDQLSQYFY
jgi:hypothetical protein